MPLTFFQKLKYFCIYYSKSITIYDIHSPFLSKILLPLLYEKLPSFRHIEKRRFSLRIDEREIEKLEFGAGSPFQTSKPLKVKIMAKHSPISPKEGAQLSVIASNSSVKNILELGTHFGLSGAYLLSQNVNANLFTLEGCPETAMIAKETFENLNLSSRATQYIGAFDKLLPNILPTLPLIDLIYIDGNHRGEALLENIRLLSPFLSENGIMVLSDIFWSEEMKEGWELIRRTYLQFHIINLFSFGLLILRNDKNSRRHDISIVEGWLKPWRLGIWGKQVV